jgi:uncharacterized protein (TIGR00255 family)
MTGIGRASGMIKKPPIRFDVEIKSYNHRFLEISIKAPNILVVFENEIRKAIQKRVSRGHIIVVIQQDREILPTKVEVDKNLIEAYLKLGEALKKNYHIKGTIDINTLLAVPGLIRFSQTPFAPTGIYAGFRPILEKAISAFLRMRRKEGTNTSRAVKKSIALIETRIGEIDRLIPERNECYNKHLLNLVKDCVKNLNEDRFYQELLYTVDRTDITEECKRLRSHVMLFKDALQTEDYPGRRLNFLLQEMQREANTLSVKANYLEISKSVVGIKEEIERIREQVQNIE